jgi:cytochrome c5
MRFVLLLFFCILISPLYAVEDFEQQQILERIKPVGKVRVEGKSAEPVSDTLDATASQAKVKELPGQAVYENHCVVCHGDGIAGAPKFRDTGDWQPRLSKSNIDELLAIAIKGLNAMPPKGTCGECSDEDIKNAIQYMLPLK